MFNHPLPPRVPPEHVPTVLAFEDAVLSRLAVAVPQEFCTSYLLTAVRNLAEYAEGAGHEMQIEPAREALKALNLLPPNY